MGFGLVLTMVLSSGCRSLCRRFYPCPGGNDVIVDTLPTGADGPWLKGGIVRVRRGFDTIAYVSRDPTFDEQQHWVLQFNEELPLDVGTGTTLTFEYMNSGNLDLHDLCAMYKDVPELKWINPDTGMPESPRGWTLYSTIVGGEPCPE